MNQERNLAVCNNIISVNKKLMRQLLTTSSSFAFLTVTIFDKHPILLHLYMKALLSEILHMTVATLLESTLNWVLTEYTQNQNKELRKLLLS